jgi:hypothetical protein
MFPFETQLNLQKIFANLKICCIEDDQENLKIYVAPFSFVKRIVLG